ncbi:TIM barrel protein [Candidatus Pelagibacter ubique]|uniref:sugar phosphate isomerase/epimerase family protein n=1 Tax=Pelagibacter ubique TaxID=198252 RepID=UPI000402043C
MLEKIGIMQGRLVPREIKSRIQSFPWTNWIKEIRLAKKYKIRYIEWTLDYKNFLSNPLIQKPILVKKILKKNNIKLNSITADFFMQKPVWSKKKQETNNFLLKLLNICNQLNIEFIVIPLVDNSSIKKENQKKIVNYFKLLKKNNNLKKTKILFEVDLLPKKVNSFIDSLDKSFGINYDTGNSAFFGYNFDDEKHYFNRVLNIHIKDRKKGGQTTTLGKGDVDFELLFKYLSQIKYKNNLILQTYMPKNGKKVKNETLKNLSFIKNKIHEK